MYINQNAGIERHRLPGLEHQTLAGRRDGLQDLEVWRQTIEAGAETPVHRHACEEVVVVLRGSGVCRIEGQDRAFNEDETLVIPPNVVHQIMNTGVEALSVISVLGRAPVRVETADGEPLVLPWD